MRITISDSFYPLLADRHRYLILCGGRGSGKSEFAARKLFFRCVTEGNHRFLVLRKIRARVKESALEVIKRVLDENEIQYEYKISDRTILFANPNGRMNEILFDGLDDPEKIKSIKGVTGIWIEEATEFTERDFLGVDLVLREAGPLYHQIILSFNPDEAQAPWLKKRFFDEKDKDATVHVSTIDDNPIQKVRDTYRERLDLISDPVYQKIYRFGEWAAIRGVIFGNWDVQSLPEGVSFNAVFYGGDFGYSVDPAGVVKVYRKADEYWLEELLYRTELTNQDLGQALKSDQRFDSSLRSYWDSAEPKSIEELSRMGINAIGAEKGPDSVRAGIDFMRSRKIHVVPPSPNLIKEKNGYRFKPDKNGDPTNEPVDYMDHLMSAARYGIYTEVNQVMPNIRSLR